MEYDNEEHRKIRFPNGALHCPPTGSLLSQSPGSNLTKSTELLGVKNPARPQYLMKMQPSGKAS